ncbi:MAG: response regulator [Fimbriimonadales bacterium]
MALNVMVVDDSAVMRSVIIKTLKMSGLAVGEIFEARNGVEGLQLLQDNWVDLALLDINMPEMNGEEMLERVRETPETSDLNVIVVSTEGSESRINHLKSLGASFVHKPFSPEQLRNVVIELTGESYGTVSTPSFGSSDSDF